MEKGHTKWGYTGREDPHGEKTYEEGTHMERKHMSKGQIWRGREGTYYGVGIHLQVGA